MELTLSLNDINTTHITNCRKDLQVADLLESISETGIQSPLGVVTQGDSYALVFGFRRYQAAKELGLETVPCRVIEAETESDLYVLNLQENVSRQDLNPMEEAEALQRIIESGREVDQFRKAIGWSKTRITQRLGLLSLSAALKEAISDNRISVGQARAINEADEGFHPSLIELASEGMTVKAIKLEVDQVQAFSGEPLEDDDLLAYDNSDEEVTPLPEEDEEDFDESLDEVSLDVDAEDRKARAEADSNVIKSFLLDSGAKVLRDDKHYFGFQVAVNAVDFSKLPQGQRDALVSALNMLSGENGIDAWGEAHKR